MKASERIAHLRAGVLERKRQEKNYPLHLSAIVGPRSLRASEDVASWPLRRGMLTRDLLSAMEFEANPLDILAGRLKACPGDISEASVLEGLEYLKAYPHPPGQAGHCELHMAPVLRQGIDGIAADIQALKDEASGAKADTYSTFLLALEGLSQMITNAADAVEAALPGAPAECHASLRTIADSCRRVDHEPPQSFRDAIQLLWFVIVGAAQADGAGLNVPGHLDRTLAGFYAQDRAAGVLSRDEALLLIEGLYLLVNDFVDDGLAVSVMVGGRDAEGKDVTNDLSYLCLEALRRTRLIYPTVGICWHEGTPAKLSELAIELIGHGLPTPAFFGDETIQRGLKGLGVPPDEACYYINSTCVEITPATGSNVWVASPYHSTCKILLLEIAKQVEEGVVCEDFEDFRNRYYDFLAEHIAVGARNENEFRGLRKAHGGKPLQSVFTRDCITRGRDIDDGGALYNWVECSFVGLANLADALYVIREEVFRRKQLTTAELKDILDVDFEGHEDVRRRFAEAYPKYGHDDAEVDALFADTVAFVQRECARQTIAPDDSPLVPGAFSWVSHEVLGRDCGATPDARRSGVPFADGCGPAQGREVYGPTAAILSTTSWDHSPMIGGLAYNMKFNASMFESPSGFAALRDLVLTFLRRGGFETQVNAVDTATMKKARANPEAYRDLIVRIGGYTDYFTRLSPRMQEELIMRTEFTHA